MELDHVFIFTASPEQAVDSLCRFGLTEGTPNVHPGQGTSCNRFFFENAYLELVWVSNEVEIKSPLIAETKLWERSQYQTTHYCPFGICFRNTNAESRSSMLIFEDGWKYKPPYLEEGMYVNIASNTDFPAEPMFFEMPFFRRSPEDYSSERRQPLHHKKGFDEITKVTLTLPAAMERGSTAMQKVLRNNKVAVLKGESFSMTLEFDYGVKEETQDFYPLIPLSVKW